MAGPGPTFARILPGAAWIDDRLVYFAVQGQQKVLVDGKRVVKLKGTATSPSLESRPLPSADGLHYAAFDSTGATVRWYLDGKLQSSTFDRLAAVPVVAPRSKPMFVTARGCLLGVVGDPSTSGYRWDIVNWVRSSADGKFVYSYGHRANLPRLELNGKKVYEGTLDQFAHSSSGATWMGVSEQTIDDVVQTDILKDGKVVASANTDRSRVSLTMASDGTTWAMGVSDEDYVAMTLTRPGQPDRRFEQAPLEYHLSSDGKTEAMVFRSTADPSKLDISVDGKVVYLGASSIRSNHFPLSQGGRFAFTLIEGPKRSVVSHLGNGPAYDELSNVTLLRDGRPAYVGTVAGKTKIHVGSWSAELVADNVHFVSTFRLDGDQLRILGPRGKDVVAFSVTVN